MAILASLQGELLHVAHDLSSDQISWHMCAHIAGSDAPYRHQSLHHLSYNGMLVCVLATIHLCEAKYPIACYQGTYADLATTGHAYRAVACTNLLSQSAVLSRCSRPASEQCCIKAAGLAQLLFAMPIADLKSISCLLFSCTIVFSWRFCDDRCCNVGI